jgi:deoxyribodipyrimidine photo-lyase
MLYGFELGRDYPFPIVNLEETRKFSSDFFWSMRKNETVKKDSKRILEKHTFNDELRD